MPFRDVLGQDYAIALIRNSIKKGRIPQSWLFTGQKNIGKFKTAVALSQKLNCRKFADDACGECDYCVQIENQNFLDFRVILPEGKNIKINQIKKSLDWLHLHSDQAKIRVMIIDDARNLGREAANALLKTLEEPSPNTLLIIIAESSKHIPETIVSRCQQIRFRPLSDGITKQILQQTTDLSSERINYLCSFSMGSVKTHLATRIELIEDVQQKTIDWLTNLSSLSLNAVFQNFEKWGKSKNGECNIFLDFLETWFRDLIFILYECPEDMLINKVESSSESRIVALKKSALYFNIERIQEIFWHIIEVRKSIELNANKSLMVESLFLLIYRKKQ